MEMKVKVLVEMPGVMESILALAEAFEGYRRDVLGSGVEGRLCNNELIDEGADKAILIDRVKSEILNEIKNEVKLEVLREIKSKALVEVKEEEISLEEVRAVLARIYRSGKRLEVCNILNGLGYAKLVDVPKEFYGEILSLARNLEREVA